MNLLGSRLLAVIELLERYSGKETFADIGSDHAFLAIEVLKRRLANKAIAADINEQPLLKGKQNAESLGFDIEFILSDGFDAFDGRKIDSAAICGMGGELIAKIVLRSQCAKDAFLVLQPMTAQEELRKSLWDNGFDIVSEKFVIENSKTYVVMGVKFDGTKRSYTYNELFLGKVRPSTPEFSKYCEKVRFSAEKRRLGLLARSESTEEIDGLIAFCQTQTTNFS